MSQPEIRIMESHDTRAALELGEQAGWNQTEADWQRLLALEPEGCFVAGIDGALAGTVTTLRYGRSLGWIGMMLVDPRFRRRGIATALMERAIAYLHERRVETLKLDATDVGRAVYRTLGFEDEYALTRWEGTPGRIEGPVDDAIALLGEADREGVITLDRESFGVDRSDLLRSLWPVAPGKGFVRRARDGVLQGFLLTRPGARAQYLGPWCASTPAIAGSLLQAAIGAVGPARAFMVDIAAPCPAAASLLAPLGFRAARSCMRMRLGPARRAGVAERIYGISGFETG